MTSVLEIAGLGKRFGDVVAVDDVSFSVRRGAIVGFVGPNGAGKSTTMRSIFGLVVPDRGTISWDGRPVDGLARNRFGYMPEQRGLYPKMQIAEQVAFFGELKGLSREASLAEATELLEALGLGDRLSDPLEKLSHGNQQRVQLAVSLVADPELLVLDEPFNGLDPVAVSVLEEALAARVAGGVGVLFSSHQLELVERISHDVVIIVDGSVRAAGSIADVRRASGRQRVSVEVLAPAASLATAFSVPVISHAVAPAPSGTTPRSETVVLDVADDAVVAQVLREAQAQGTVARFDFDAPSLTEAFADIATRTEARTGALRDDR